VLLLVLRPFHGRGREYVKIDELVLVTARWASRAPSCRHRGRPVTRAWLGNVAGNKCQPLWSPTELASIVTVEARTPSQAIENKRKFGSPSVVNVTVGGSDRVARRDRSRCDGLHYLTLRHWRERRLCLIQRTAGYGPVCPRGVQSRGCPLSRFSATMSTPAKSGRPCPSRR
jgi:hypothetical protein